MEKIFKKSQNKNKNFVKFQTNNTTNSGYSLDFWNSSHNQFKRGLLNKIQKRDLLKKIIKKNKLSLIMVNKMNKYMSSFDKKNKLLLDALNLEYYNNKKNFLNRHEVVSLHNKNSKLINYKTSYLMELTQPVNILNYIEKNNIVLNNKYLSLILGEEKELKKNEIELYIYNFNNKINKLLLNKSTLFNKKTKSLYSLYK